MEVKVSDVTILCLLGTYVPMRTVCPVLPVGIDGDGEDEDILRTDCRDLFLFRLVVLVESCQMESFQVQWESWEEYGREAKNYTQDNVTEYTGHKPSHFKLLQLHITNCFDYYIQNVHLSPSRRRLPSPILSMLPLTLLPTPILILILVPLPPPPIRTIHQLQFPGIRPSTHEGCLPSTPERVWRSKSPGIDSRWVEEFEDYEGTLVFLVLVCVCG